MVGSGLLHLFNRHEIFAKRNQVAFHHQVSHLVVSWIADDVCRASDRTIYAVHFGLGRKIDHLHLTFYVLSLRSKEKH